MNGTLAIVVWAQGPDSPSPGRQSPPSFRDPYPWPPVFLAIRDLILFVGGLAGLYHQFAIADEAQIVLVGVAAAAAMIPIPLRLDERRKNGS